MLTLVERALHPFFAEDSYALVGFGQDQVRQIFPEERTIEQTEQLGTGHALGCALPLLLEKGYDRVLVVNGDAPLLTTTLVESFLEKSKGTQLAFATSLLDDPASYGRVIREGGNVKAIVEAKDYSPAVHGDNAHEINVGLYDIDLSLAHALLPKVQKNPLSGEFYITDLVALSLEAGYSVEGVPLGQDDRLLGVNSPLELVHMEEVLRREIIHALLEKGVLLHAPDLIRISLLAEIEAGCEITGPCEIYGQSHIHTGARIDSHCVIRHSDIASGAQIRSFSHLDGAIVEANALVGPYARLRPGAHLEEESHVGNFVELKKARLGKGAKANHLTYLGDAIIGGGTNIGAGTITCNYDGKNKHQTIIGEKAFIGSNTALVAPVTVGASALIGAGSTITHDVPEQSLSVARAKQKNYPQRIVLA